MKKKRYAFFTICSMNYLAQAAVLKESLAATHPSVDFIILLCDQLSTPIPQALKGTEIIPVEEIGIPDFDLMTGLYSILELNTSIKPFCFSYLFSQKSYDAVFYLDPDLYFKSEMIECFGALDKGADIILTPHTLNPLEDGYAPSDFHLSNAGIYNLGFCVVKNSDEGRRFIGWWSRKLSRDCRIDLENGIFVDQKWCDGVPALFNNVTILRHPGYNIAYWNLVHRDVYFDPDAGWLCNNEPLRFFHFSGIGMESSQVVSKHQDRLAERHLTDDLKSLFLEYRSKLIHNDYFDCVKSKVSFPIYSLISQESLLSKQLAVAYEAAILPKQNVGYLEFVASAATTCKLTPADDDLEPVIPDILFAIRQIRPDLIVAFDLSSKESRIDFLRWGEDTLRHEYEISETLMTQFISLLRYLRTAKWLPAQMFSADAKEMPDMISVLSSWSSRQISELVTSFYTDFSPQYTKDSDIALPLFLLLVYERRQDLRDLFDLTTTSGRVGLLNWARQHFQTEYSSCVEALPCLRAIKKHGKKWPIAVAEQSQSAGHELASLKAEMEYGLIAPADYALFSADRRQLQKSASGAARLKAGATLIGYPTAETGMGEHVRNTALALKNTKTPFSVFNANTGMTAGMKDRSVADKITDALDRQVNVFQINADQTIHLHRILGEQLVKGRFNVGYWFWELENFPEAWQPAIDVVDELWAPTKFIGRALRQTTDKPIFHMPIRVEPKSAATIDLSKYDIPKNAFVFLFYFDFNSYMERKNPWAAIRAFQQAFPVFSSSRPVCLLIKAIGEDTNPERLEELNAVVAVDKRIKVISGSVSRAEMNGLIKASSAFLSLHRSEGFGRGPAEAMFYGKPTIATGYSGNMDFMNQDNSLLVDYSLYPVGETGYPYAGRSRWAKPDEDHAAYLIKWVVENEKEAKTKGKKAAHYIKKHHSTQAIGRLLARRLAEIEQAAGK